MERPKLAPILERAVAAGVLTEAQARDVDALADGLASRVTSGELTQEQCDELARDAAQRDGAAVRRARKALPFAWGARPCTVCRGLRGVHVAASHVARAADGLEWFECGAHEPTDNVAGVERARLTPIAEWFASHGLPLPGEAEP